MLQVVARECGTINYTARVGGLHSRRATRKMMQVQPMKLCEGCYAMKGGIA